MSGASPSPAATAEPFVLVPEAAVVLRVKERTVRRYCASGLLEATRLGVRGPWKIFPEPFKKFCAAAGAVSS